jgi:glycosyltransferase involved in cell wall biosynthesis
VTECSLMYVHTRSMGYGRMGTDIAAAMEDLGVTIYDDLGEPPSHLPTSEVPLEGRVRSEKPTNVVCWLSTPTHANWWWNGQYRSILTMWEASNLPPSFRDSFHCFDLIMVPSQQNYDLFSEHHDNVRLNPLGVDPKRWHYLPRRDPERQFRFLIGGSGPRKGCDLAFRAFRTVFGNCWDDRGNYTGKGPEPRLVMKNPRGEDDYIGWHGVEVVAGRLSDEEEEALYETCHVYVQPSRGEGFGLQPLQAMAQGMPTILTDAHGHSSFAKHGIPLDWSWEKAHYFIFGDAGYWWEPDFEQLCEAMWDTYHNYETHLAHAENVAKLVIPDHFTWKHTAQRLIDAHDGEMDRPYAGDATYAFPTFKKYRVRVLPPGHRAHVGGSYHIWLPGQDYWESADVKRILFDAGKLDPDCLEGVDHGLADEQVAEIGGYSASKEWCPTCQRRMDPSDETLVDVLERAS